MHAESATPEVQNHAIRLYYIRCAEHALKFAPLPEFKDAIALTRWFDDEPDEEKHEMLVEIYENLRSHNYLYDRDAEVSVRFRPSCVEGMQLLRTLRF